VRLEMLGKLSEFVIKIGVFIFKLHHALPEIEFNYQERNELINLQLLCVRDAAIVKVLMDSQ